MDIYELLNSAGGGHSAEVQITLFSGETAVEVAQMGAGRLIFSDPITLPESHGSVVLSIDGHEQRWTVAIKPHSQPTREVETEFRAAR